MITPEGLQLLRETIDWDAKKAPLTKDVVGALLDHIDALTRERDAAALAEREACAALCDRLSLHDAIPASCARAIRARSTPAPVQP